MDILELDIVRNDIGPVLEEYFTDREQFVLYAQEQDYDIDTCMELCDTVRCLNEAMDGIDATQRT
ncbi:AaceriAAL088WAp [[Ashbya] aceris (nom. inval.)]|nr:AaceriAAL088WAp [[Ashbya] aceris (nom. inval.)]